MRPSGYGWLCNHSPIVSNDNNFENALIIWTKIGTILRCFIMLEQEEKMEERLTNQILVNKDDYQDEFKFDICRSIEELNKLPFEFYVSGGVICKYLLKEHSRYARDIDIVTKRDLKEVESILRQHLDVVEFVSSPITELFLEETFICLIKVDGKIVQIDGMRVDFFDEIKPEIYMVNDISFKGVPFEYLVATKILAVTSNVERPFKHLVDIYSASLIGPSLLDKQEIKKYMLTINDSENKARKMLKKQEIALSFSIEKEKSFSGSKILNTLQAGYNVSKETMVEEVNEWLSTF